MHDVGHDVAIQAADADGRARRRGAQGPCAVGVVSGEDRREVEARDHAARRTLAAVAHQDVVGVLDDHALGHGLQRVLGADRRRLAGDRLGGARRAGQHAADDVACCEHAGRAGIDHHGVHLMDAHERRHLGQRRARRARDESGGHDLAGLQGRERGSASDRVHGDVLRARQPRGIGPIPPSPRG